MPSKKVTKVAEKTAGMYVCLGCPSIYLLTFFQYFYRFLLAKLHTDSLATAMDCQRIDAALKTLSSEVNNTYDEADCGTD